MFRRRETISAFDIEAGLVKFAYFVVDKALLLNKLVVRGVRSNSPDNLAKALGELLPGQKLAGSRIVVNFPRHKATVKNIKLPSANPAEIENMVCLQASKELPIPPEKLISTYKILETDKSGYTNVMMVLVQRELIEETLKAFELAGLEIERLVLSSEAINLFYVNRYKPNQEKGTICLVDIGKRLLEMQVVKDAAPIFTRSVNFSSPEALSQNMLDEIKKSVYTCKKTRPDVEIAKIVLTGKRSVLGNEAAALKRELGLPTVYLDALKAPLKAEGFIEPNDDSVPGESFTALISLGLYRDSLRTNLIPQKIRARRARLLAREGAMMSVILLLGIILGISSILARNYLAKKNFLRSIDATLTRTMPKVETLSRIKGATEMIKRYIDLKNSSVDVIRELYSKMPPGILLTIFDFEDGRSCLLRGTSQKLSDVFKFISILEESPYFENVKVRYATKRVFRKKELTDFELTAQLTT